MAPSDKLINKSQVDSSINLFYQQLKLIDKRRVFLYARVIRLSCIGRHSGGEGTSAFLWLPILMNDL